MKTVVLDFETYYDSEYSLRKMTPVEYIMDPRFEVIGCAVIEDGVEVGFLSESELSGYLAGLGDQRVLMLSHNALFDMCIVAWHFGYLPTLMVDTLAMARSMLGHRLRSMSLDSVTSFLGLGTKGKTVHKVMGMRLDDIKRAGIFDEYAEYSLDDAFLCLAVYRHLVAAGFPVAEVIVMDTVLRCAVAPRFQLNQNLLFEHLQATLQGKEDLLVRCGLATRDDLMSNDRFADALRSLGVEPPRKISLRTGQETYAFAKTDTDFIALEEHEDPMVQAVVAARMGIKSTIEETRTQRLISISQIEWAGGVRGLMPVPLRYSGAHTHRLSGDWKLNMQNLPSRGNNRIRMAIEAPKGHKVIAVDSSQIEARIAAWFCGVSEMVTAFASKEDVYSSFATSVFGYPVNKKEHPVERFVGKTGILGLQYGLGWPKFQGTVALQSKAQLGNEILLTDADAARTVNTYRTRYHQIPRMWNTLNGMIPRMTGDLHHEIHPVTFVKNAIRLPSGLHLHYHNLRSIDGQWWFDYGGKPKYLYGGKMLENIVQALARICVMDAAVRVRRALERRALDVWLNLQVHDELVYVVPDALVEEVVELVMCEMCVRPSWAPELPLDAEAGVGQSFGDT